MKDRRRKAFRAGVKAERIAALFLMFKGYRILAFRFKTVAGEIDLIASKHNRLVFIEVKTRSNSELCEGDLLSLVTPRQQGRIRRAADLWMSKNRVPASRDVGFDIIILRPWSLPRHYKDAFPHLSS